MKALVVVLAIVATLLGFLYLNSVQPGRPAQVETMIVTQLVERPAITTEVERTVTVTVTNTAELEEKVAALRNDLLKAQENLQTEEVKASELDKERVSLLLKLGGVSNELLHVQRQYAGLKSRNTATEAELRQVQSDKNALELEKASLERRLNNLDDLRAQIALVKKELWSQKVAEWKRTDAAAAEGGNKGYLMLKGQWTGSRNEGPK
jgi:chromosome segregation ATPase